MLTSLCKEVNHTGPSLSVRLPWKIPFAILRSLATPSLVDLLGPQPIFLNIFNFLMLSFKTLVGRIPGPSPPAPCSIKKYI
jgi:hypothetical protein